MTQSASSDILTVVLTDSQRDILAPIVRRAVRNHQGVVFVSVSPFIDAGQQHWGLQAKFLGSRDAGKALKIIREAKGD